MKRVDFSNLRWIASAITALAVLQTMTAPAFAAVWRIDPAKTTIAFAIDAVGFPRTEGRFDRFEGRISVDFEHPDRSSVIFHVQAQSVDVGSASFSDYLRSTAFLELGGASVDRLRLDVGQEDQRSRRARHWRSDLARGDQADRR